MVEGVRVLAILVSGLLGLRFTSARRPSANVLRIAGAMLVEPHTRVLIRTSVINEKSHKSGFNRLLVEAAGVEPASASTLPLVLHA